LIASSPPVPELVTRRLRLRRLEVEDASDLHLAYGDAGAMRFWDAPPSPDVAETRRRIEDSRTWDSTWHASWAVVSAATGHFIGMANYHARNARHRRLAVGWILLPRYWGQGYMHEAMDALLAHCFGTLDTHRVEAEIEPDNRLSIRLAERLGFRCEGLLRDRMSVAGEPRSICMYALLRPEWSVP
jgi:[ribosomal protein S5]-alanine N-acetyltransferase